MNSQTRQVLCLFAERKISLEEAERLLRLIGKRSQTIGSDVAGLITQPEISQRYFDQQSIDKLVPRIDMGNIYPYI